MSVLYVPQCGLIKSQRRRAKSTVLGTFFAPSLDEMQSYFKCLVLGCESTQTLHIPGFNSFGCTGTLKATMGFPQSQEPCDKKVSMRANVLGSENFTDS